MGPRTDPFGTADQIGLEAMPMAPYGRTDVDQPDTYGTTEALFPSFQTKFRLSEVAYSGLLCRRPPTGIAAPMQRDPGTYGKQNIRQNLQHSSLGGGLVGLVHQLKSWKKGRRMEILSSCRATSRSSTFQTTDRLEISLYEQTSVGSCWVS